MTICISVKVAEGLVLAADSAVMLQGTLMTPQGPQQTILQTFSFANKLAHFKDYPIGILSWGLGSISSRSIQSLIMEFEHSFPARPENPNYTLLDIAHRLLEFIRPRYDAAYQNSPQNPGLGMLVGGFSHGEFFPEEFRSELPGAPDWKPVRPNLQNGVPDFGANWFGMTDALVRLILGYDPPAIDELVKRGADQNIVKKWVEDHVSSLPLVFDGMPLQDAVDFANYAAQVVIGRYRFGLGPVLCGGDVDIAVITPSALRWAQRKRWAISE